MSTSKIPQNSASSQVSILASLEPDQLAQAKLQKVPRRYLHRSQVLLLWSLRVYLLFMVAVVIYQLWAGA